MTKFSWYFSEIGALGRPSAFADSKTTAIANCSEHMEIGCYEFGMNSMMSISSECRLAFGLVALGVLNMSAFARQKELSGKSDRQVIEGLLEMGRFYWQLSETIYYKFLCAFKREIVSYLLWIQKIWSSRLEQCSKFDEIGRMIAEDR